MKKLILLCIFFCCGSLAAFANESKGENSGVQATQHTPHPPHDHQDHDHLKYLRDDKRSKNKRKTVIS